MGDVVPFRQPDNIPASTAMPGVHITFSLSVNGLPVNGLPVIGTASNADWVCPDLLRYEQIGAADRLRGRVVRAFFWLLRVWPVNPR
jgi:hypothetical protein